MKVRKSKTVSNLYYILGANYIRMEGVFAEFSEAGNVKLGVFPSDIHLYPEQLFDVLYIKKLLVWIPLFNNGVLC